MSKKYILGIDQSTSGTKALLFDDIGIIVARYDLPHEQIINDKGWVEHDPLEIFRNVIKTVKNVLEKSGIDRSAVIGIGISNQRETALVWDRESGDPVYNAVVWQCARGEDICKRISNDGKAEKVREITGLPLSPFFSAAKIAWVLENTEIRDRLLCAGTIDSWLIYKLTGNFSTDYSNASRTQLFDIKELRWSEEICSFFGIDISILPQVIDSDSRFGYTDIEGLLDIPIPIHCVMGDSHGALFGQGCFNPGMLKVTYGTGSSIMMNIGKVPLYYEKGIATSIAWGKSGNVEYVLEGNINYTGAVIKWIVDDLNLIDTPEESSGLAAIANPEDETYLVPAFSGLGAPYWNSEARAIICGMSRTTGKAEIVRAALESIAYQVSDVINIIRETIEIDSEFFQVDGGATCNDYLMQFQSDITGFDVHVPVQKELSGIGVSYMAGIALGLYDKDVVFNNIERKQYLPQMDSDIRRRKIEGWHESVNRVL